MTPTLQCIFPKTPGPCVSGSWRVRLRGLAARVGRGFSLVEVVIALGVIAFCILPVIGVLAIAHSQMRDSARQAELTLVTHSVEAVLRGELQRGRLANTSSFDRLRATLSGEGTNLYFGEGGRWIPGGAGGQLPVGAYYRATVSTNAMGTNSRDRIGVLVRIFHPLPDTALVHTNLFTLSRSGSQF